MLYNVSKTKWSKKIVHWEDENNHYFSIVFSWDLHEFCKSVQPEIDGKNIIIGGPAAYLNPEWVPDWITIGKNAEALKRHNPEATRTTLGCIRKCPFCAVPKLEPEFEELKEWEVKPILTDNNFLASSRKHFDSVIDKIKKLETCEFNQGLDARLLKKYHAERFSECNIHARLAFDNTKDEQYFLQAFQYLRDAGIPKSRISVYVLIGFLDTPDDALYRFKIISDLGIKPYPMRYQPNDTKEKNNYVSENWTNEKLFDFMKYWSSFHIFKGIPFDNFKRKESRRKKFSYQEICI